MTPRERVKYSGVMFIPDLKKKMPKNICILIPVPDSGYIRTYIHTYFVLRGGTSPHLKALRMVHSDGVIKPKSRY
jgi:hypothetical protein